MLPLKETLDALRLAKSVGERSHGHSDHAADRLAGRSKIDPNTAHNERKRLAHTAGNGIRVSRSTNPDTGSLEYTLERI